MLTGLRFGAPNSRARHVPSRWRVIALLLAGTLLAGAIWSRLAYWQVVQHVQLSAEAQAQYHELVELPAIRGAIFDRNMRQLVINTTVYSAFVSPDQIPDDQRARVALALGSVLGADANNVNKVLASGKKFAYIARRFSKAKADQLRAMLNKKAYAESKRLEELAAMQ